MWFEEPVNAQDLDAYLEVKAALPRAIAGGENLRTRYEFKPYLTRRAYDIVQQPDIMHCGGITEMQRICAMANACGIQVNPHVWGSPVMIAATLHLAATLPPCPPARNAQPYMQEPVMEFDRTPSAIRQELCAVPFEQEDSFVRVPTEPGLGIEVDEEVVERFAGLSVTASDRTEHRSLGLTLAFTTLLPVGCPARGAQAVVAIAGSLYGYLVPLPARGCHAGSRRPLSLRPRGPLSDPRRGLGSGGGLRPRPRRQLPDLSDGAEPHFAWLGSDCDAVFANNCALRAG